MKVYEETPTDLKVEFLRCNDAGICRRSCTVIRMQFVTCDKHPMVIYPLARLEVVEVIDPCVHNFHFVVSDYWVTTAEGKKL